MTDFSSLGLSRPILDALAARGLTAPTPIQTQAIPELLTGRDVLGLAQTGSGKTAAFALPLLERFIAVPGRPVRGMARALVLAPTRELAAQCLEQINLFGRGLNIRTSLAIGGASIRRQKAELRNGVDVLVATPGRLVDLVEQRAISLEQVEYFVLDEVDQMLDLGFIHAIRKIASWLPERRQNVFFSATLAKNVEKLARGFLVDPAEVRVSHGPKPKIAQHVRHVSPPEKAGRLTSIVGSEAFESGLVFARTKRGADRVAKTLNAAGFQAFAIHGNRSQNQRENALRAFKSGRCKILVATDIAARGIDIAGVSHVINFDLPATPETYVHRIGRTGRAGASGTAISFCTPEERNQLRAIERLVGKSLDVDGEAPAPDASTPKSSAHDKPRRRKPRPQNGAKPQQARAPKVAGAKTDAASGEKGAGRPRRRRRKGAARQNLQGAA